MSLLENIMSFELSVILKMMLGTINILTGLRLRSQIAVCVGFVYGHKLLCSWACLRSQIIVFVDLVCGDKLLRSWALCATTSYCVRGLCLRPQIAVSVGFV